MYRDKKEVISEILRVNHAGELGAKRIYEGQIAFTKDQKQKKLMLHMKEQELEHLRFFENEIPKRKARPTIMTPFWEICAYGLGAATAMMGAKAAMACTEAVEEVINEHYLEQISVLENFHEETELKDKIEKFRQEELEHQRIAVENDAHEAPVYEILGGVVRGLCKIAINISKKI